MSVVVILGAVAVLACLIGSCMVFFGGSDSVSIGIMLILIGLMAGASSLWLGVLVTQPKPY